MSTNTLLVNQVPSNSVPIHMNGDCAMGRRMTLPDYVFKVTARDKPYYYFQRGRGTPTAGSRIRLPDDPQSPEFWQKWRALAGLDDPEENPNSFDTLIQRYLESPEFSEKALATQRQYQRHCALISRWWGHLEVAGLTPAVVLKARDKLRATPAEANGLLRSLSALLAWSIPRGFRDDNPCEFVAKLKTGDGWQPWPWEMIEYSREVCPRWMRQAIVLAVYTGQRQGDVLAMQWGQIRSGMITVRQSKTGHDLVVPLHRELQAELALMPKRALTILTTQRDTPWTPDGFRASWRKSLPAEIKAAGLVFHGLRKSAVVTLLEAGCTDAEVAAITGQSRQMVEHYARQVNQRKLAKAAVLKWEQS
jgi:integrase